MKVLHKICKGDKKAARKGHKNTLTVFWDPAEKRDGYWEFQYINAPRAANLSIGARADPFCFLCRKYFLPPEKVARGYGCLYSQDRIYAWG